MSYTSGNSSKASKKEVKEVKTEDNKMGFTVNVIFPRIHDKEGLIVKTGEMAEYISDLEEFKIGPVEECKIEKENDKIVKVESEKSKFVLAKNGKYVRGHKARKTEKDRN